MVPPALSPNLLLKASAVALGLSLLTLAAFLLHVLAGVAPRADELFDHVVYNAVTATAAIALLLRAAARRQDRAAWLAIGVGLLSWSAGDAYYVFVLADLPDPPSPSPADPLYLAFYPCCYLGLGLLARRRLSGLAPSAWLDGLVTGLGAACVAAAVLVGPIVTVTGGTPASVVTNLMYPVGDLTLLAVSVVIVGATGWRPGRLWTLVAVSLVVTAVADAVYLHRAAEGSYVEGTWLDTLWPAASVLLALAAWAPVPRASRRPADAGRLLAVPAAAVTAGALVLFLDHGDTDVNLLARVLALATLLAAGARTALAFRESRQAIELGRVLARTDPLTGLGNRRMLVEDLGDAVLDARDDDPRLLMLFDLNGFKGYNDTYGHPAGDALLVRLAGALEATVAAHGRAYRLGGDEFCVLVRPGRIPLAVLAASMGAALSEAGDGFEITAAGGYALLPSEARDVDSALQVADRRLYAAKDRRPSSAKRQLHGVLLQAIREREPALDRHGRTVAGLAGVVGRRLGMDAEALDVLTRAAELHDIGKMAVPDAILEKPGPLDDEERAFMRRHTVLGQRILDAAPAMRPVAALVRSSHERWDGGGYPDALAGHDIPLGSRIIFVCDAYEAMTSDRSYRRATTHERAVAELRAGAGTQFDPDVVAVFCAVTAPAAADPADPAGATSAAG